MAAIDEKRAEENRWLPDDLFPLVTHRIAASRRSYYRGELAGGKRKRNIGQGFCFPVQCMIGITDIIQFEDWVHKVTSVRAVYYLVYEKIQPA